MAPIPKAPPSVPEPKLYARTHPATPDDDIVISGVSGSFPNSKNVEEFAHNLYNKVCGSHRIDVDRFLVNENYRFPY